MAGRHTNDVVHEVVEGLLQGWELKHNEKCPVIVVSDRGTNAAKAFTDSDKLQIITCLMHVIHWAALQGLGAIG